MKTLILALVVSMKIVAKSDAYYVVNDDGTGVWWELLTAQDGSTCRALWVEDSLIDRWVECKWVPKGKVQAEAPIVNLKLKEKP